MHLLFVCTGNTCRSPMAAFLARRQLAERGLDWTVSSAGLSAAAGASMTPPAVQALIRRNVPLHAHQAQAVTEDLMKSADKVLAMTTNHARELRSRFPHQARKVEVLGSYLRQDQHGDDAECDIVDPFGGSDEVYEQSAATLEQAVERLIEHLTGKGSAQ